MTALMFTPLWYEQLVSVVLSYSQTAIFSYHVVIFATGKTLCYISSNSNMHNLRTLRFFQKENVKIWVKQTHLQLCLQNSNQTGQQSTYIS